MNERSRDNRSSSCLGRVFLISAAIIGLVLLTMNVYRPDAPISAIVPGSSSAPSFAVQIVRPREGLPLGGLLPPQLFGVDAELGFNSKSANSRYALERKTLTLSAANWELRLVYDATGLIQPGSEVLFDLIFEDRVRRVRCKPSPLPVGSLEMSEIAPNEFSGNFVIELPICEDAETGQSLGWPPKPFILRGSFDRLPTVESSN